MKILKIKDNVNLKEELEKLGFKVTIKDTYIKDIENSNYEQFETSILINPTNKIVDRQVVIYFNNNDYINMDEDEIDLTANIALLYDLLPLLEVVNIESEEV